MYVCTVPEGHSFETLYYLDKKRVVTCLAALYQGCNICKEEKESTAHVLLQKFGLIKIERCCNDQSLVHGVTLIGESG